MGGRSRRRHQRQVQHIALQQLEAGIGAEALAQAPHQVAVELDRQQGGGGAGQKPLREGAAPGPHFQQMLSGLDRCGGHDPIEHRPIGEPVLAEALARPVAAEGHGVGGVWISRLLRRPTQSRPMFPAFLPTDCWRQRPPTPPHPSKRSHRTPPAAGGRGTRAATNSTGQQARSGWPTSQQAQARPSRRRCRPRSETLPAPSR